MGGRQPLNLLIIDERTTFKIICYCLWCKLAGMPAVINLALLRNLVNNKPATLDGVEVGEALRRLEAAGADVVGLNCSRGPATMLPLFENLEKGSIKVRLI